MSQSYGRIAVGTKVDRQMREFVDDEAARLGVSRAEFQRRLLELYRDSRNGETVCEHCGEPSVIELKEV